MGNISLWKLSSITQVNRLLSSSWLGTKGKFIIRKQGWCEVHQHTVQILNISVSLPTIARKLTISQFTVHYMKRFREFREIFRHKRQKNNNEWMLTEAIRRHCINSWYDLGYYYTGLRTAVRKQSITAPTNTKQKLYINSIWKHFKQLPVQCIQASWCDDIGLC